ncbi:MAG: RNA polymerase sigma factor [Actinobacteria bacterium]|nr:RNA polymerase sigma factor [Actinomycetota bacterium]
MSEAAVHANVRALYDDGLEEVYGYLLHRCGDVSVAEDLTSETFLAAVAALRKEPAPLNVAWLIGVARHKLVDHWRRQERQQRALQAVEGTGADFTDPWPEHLDVLMATRVLAQLGPHHRSALTLRYVDDLPVREVARLLDRTEQATEQLLARARVAFRNAYEKGGDHAH